MTETISEVNFTSKQREALKIIGGRARYILLYGGARSGKSFVICRKIIHRALKYPGARFLIARLRYAHAKTSIFRQTLVPLAQKLVPMDDYKINWSDYYIKFFNESEIWLGGFDDKDRIDKLLGHEYLDVYPNEVSQISYDAVVLCFSRLAQVIPGVLNRAYMDCNPPSPLHWSHKLFIEKKNPKDNVDLEHPELYDHLLMNPEDNRENLPPRYIEDVLDNLPLKTRQRLKDGLWVRPSGMILENFDESMVIPRSSLPRDENGKLAMEEYIVGIDFGLNMAAVLIGLCGDKVYLIDDSGAYNMTTSMFDADLKSKWRKYMYPAYCDPSGGERIQEIAGGEKADNAVEPGLDLLNTLMEQGRFFVCEECTGWRNEAYDYRRDDKDRIIKENDHFIDASRYAIYSRLKGGIIALI